MFSYSESISSAPLETVHHLCFSLATVFCLGEASGCWFSAAAKKHFLLWHSRCPQTRELPVAQEHCFGTGSLSFHSEMLDCRSATGISFFLMAGVRCWLH